MSPRRSLTTKVLPSRMLMVSPAIEAPSEMWCSDADARGFAPLRFRYRPGRVHKTDVAERLREVAQQLAGFGVDFLSEQADIVDERRSPLEHNASPLRSVGEGHRVCEPERAEEERALFAFETIVRPVSVDEPSLVGEP